MIMVRSGVSRLLVSAALLLACAPSGGAAQQVAPESGDRRSVTAFRMADGESIELDGRLVVPGSSSILGRKCQTPRGQEVLNRLRVSPVSRRDRLA